MSSQLTNNSNYSYPTQGNNKYDINTLCNYYTYTVGSNYINVSELIEKHKPKTETELVAVINKHAPATIDYCTKLTLTRQRGLDKDKNPIDCNYSYDEIYSFIYDLLVTKSLSGIQMEKKVIRALQLKYPTLLISCSGELDEKYAVDIIIEDESSALIAAIQVKSSRYRDGTSEKILRAKQSNQERNEQFQLDYGDIPVIYFYYDSKTKKFDNTDEFLAQLDSILNAVSI